MRSFTVWSCLLLLGMAATISAKALVPTSSTEETVDMEKLTHTIEELASRPVYEGPYEVAGAVVDGPLDSTLTNDTGTVSDETNGEGKRAKRWANQFDELLYFVCPYTDSISRISSEHSNHHEDRHFSISCKKTFNVAPACYDSGWVNSFDGSFTYTCPSNYAMAGMVSYHSNYHEDRRCCGASGHRHTYCFWTGYLNDFDEYFEWNADSRSFLAGVSSYHSNYHEDRRFSFYVCINIGA